MKKSSIYLHIKIDQFPKQRKITGPSGRAVGWLKSEIDDWIAVRAAGRQSKPADPPSSARERATAVGGRGEGEAIKAALSL